MNELGSILDHDYAVAVFDSPVGKQTPARLPCSTQPDRRAGGPMLNGYGGHISENGRERECLYLQTVA